MIGEILGTAVKVVGGFLLTRTVIGGMTAIADEIEGRIKLKQRANRVEKYNMKELKLCVSELREEEDPDKREELMEEIEDLISVVDAKKNRSR